MDIDGSLEKVSINFTNSFSLKVIALNKFSPIGNDIPNQLM